MAIDIEFKRHSEIIAYQDHIEQRLDDNGDMFYIRPEDIPRRWYTGNPEDTP